MPNWETRVPPTGPEDWDDEARELLSRGMLPEDNFNVAKTLVRHPKLYKRWTVFANHCMLKSTLEPRHREITIMRVAWQVQSDYEWGQHVAMSAPAGLTATDHDRIKAGPDAEGWSAAEVALIRAVDQLLADRMLQDDRWQDLNAHFNLQQIMDIIFTTGNYKMLAMAANSFGVPREPGVPGFDG